MVMKNAVKTACAAVALALCALALAGCAQAKVADDSPRVADVRLSSTSAMTESSQDVEVKLVFDQPVSVAADAADDFEVRLNGSPLDGGAVALDVRGSADGVTFVLHPASSASTAGGKGTFFALYQSGFSVAAKRADGALPSVTAASGSCAVLDAPVTGTLPSGLAIEVIDARAGSAQDNLPAQTSFKVTSPALVRAITWFSPDGGATKLLKHNHTFADADAQDCAADLAKVVGETTGLGIVAKASGDTVTLTATAVSDGQTIDPVVVEGVGVEGGTYDASQGTGEGV
ncbi:hypothetical protein [Gordonibacter massiliensis (ex Traore et al. 2017)]|uniref:hypothetical protein n=1 Tax=Gordonibacter massiliensis (ex Traore et al. 2017) TaxID=1841863 RepID=UPI001C8C8030|nr:hypothetical protein [Gordonibacter massiliensis (ex Traore et al. 2017)]MBX9034174.1 hypothetical protein [Gordonibacter massiliensis (ex Traore et al. 2017)]